MQNREDILEAAQILSKCQRVTVLTGAGISTESGIPDFRSPESGIWTKLDPEDFTIQRFEANPERFYRLTKGFLQDILKAPANPAHRALAEMEQLGLIKSIITQNIDGLHQKGGSQKVIEVHGTLQTASCISCQTQVKISKVFKNVNQGQLPPLCEACGEPVKPDVIFFGEAMPPAYQDALTEAKKSDGMLVIGSSLVVSPANVLPQFIQRLVINNREKTPYHQKADVVIMESISQTIHRLKEALLERKIM